MRNPRTASITQPPTGLYQGYDSFLGQVRDVAISGTSNQVNAQSTILVSVCTDTDSVTEALNISGGLSGSFSDVSFAAKASWAESLSLTSTSVAVIVHSVIITGETQANSYALSITPPSDVQGFFADYGDSFVSEIVLGGEYYAAFVFDSVTVGQQQQIQVQVSGSGGPLSASLSTTINTASTSTQTSLRTSQQMLGVSTPSFPNADPDSIVTFALSFGSQSINAPTVLCYAVTGYEHVASVPVGFQSVVSNRNLLGTASSTPFVQASATLSSLSSQVATIQQMYSAYGYSGDTLFAANAAQVSQDVTALNQLITSIEANATGTYTAPLLPSLGYGTPMVSYNLNPSSAPAPNTAVDVPFFDLNPTQIANGVLPVSISLFSAPGDSTWITGIQVTYSDGTTVSRGQSTGGQLGPITIENGDSISSVSEWILMNGIAFQFWLEITTAQGRSVGVAGPSSVPHVTLNAPPAIIGFSGIYQPGVLMSLTPITITLSSALWIHPASPVSMSHARRARRQAQLQA